MSDLGQIGIEKGKNKDIILVFGNTGSGKSLYVNFLHGCKITGDAEEGYVIATPPEPPTPVGPGSSCTILPIIVDVGSKTVVDTAGYGDTRGFEIVLTNMILTQKLINQASSVRFVLVADCADIRHKRGGSWADSIKLFCQRHAYTLGDLKEGEKNPIHVVVTHAQSTEEARRYVAKYQKKDTPNFSPFVATYDPKNQNEILAPLSALDKLKKSTNKAQVILSKEEIGEVKILGDSVVNHVKEKLANGEINQILPYLKFSSRLASIGDSSLVQMHQSVERVVLQYFDKRILPELAIDSLQVISETLEKYVQETKTFSPYVNFKHLDESVNRTVLLAIAPDKRPPTMFEFCKNLNLFTGGIDFQQVASVKNVLAGLLTGGYAAI